MATAKKKAKKAKAKTTQPASAPAKWRLTDDEADAIESGIKALEQKARNIGSLGGFGSKGPIMYCQYAIYDLRRLLKRLG